jgi:serine/threonine protein kinase
MEYCNGGDLENLKEIRGRFKESDARMILQQIVQGFKEIYRMQVMHGDLKLANILVHFPNEEMQYKDIKEPIEKIEIIRKKLKTIALTPQNV